MKKLYSLFIALCFFATTYSNVIFVDQNASGVNDGSTWSNAYVFLQDAITNSVYNDTIWVATGTYFSDEGVGYTNNDRTSFFTLKDSLSILGGFDGSETMVSQRDWTVNVCVLSGDIDQSGDTLNNSNSVVSIQNVNASARLDGFTITMGVNYLLSSAGGISLNNTQAIFENLNITQNYSDVESGSSLTYGAGGVFCNNGNGPTIKNSTISANVSKTNCFWTSTSLSSRCSGGIGVLTNETILSNLIISNNTAESINTSTGNGTNGAMSAGGISFYTGPNYMVNCVISGNQTESNSEWSATAGGIFITDLGSGPIKISNVVIEGNSANSISFDTGYGAYAFSGGGIYSEYASGSLINGVTVYNNYAESSGPGIYTGSGGGYFGGYTFSPLSEVNNSIIYGNQIANGDVGFNDYYSMAMTGQWGTLPDVLFKNCLFDTYSGGTSCIVGNPDFRNTSDLNGPDDIWFTSDDGLHMGCNSDAIDNGDQSLLFADILDLDQDLDSNENMSLDIRLQNRVHNGQVDIGAFEFQGLSTTLGVGTDVVTAACGYVWIDGNVYTSNNSTATHAIDRGPDNCDSIVTLNLTVGPLTNLTPSADANVCFGNNGTTVTTSSSDNEVEYVLRDNTNDTIVDGPLTGDGSGLSFNTGALVSDMTYNVYAVNSYDGYGVDLPGGDDLIRFDNPYTAYSNEITIESWVNFNNGEHVWAGQGSPGTDNATTNVWLWHAGTFYVNDNGAWRSLAFPSLPTGWTHVATVADVTGLYIYFDGVLVALNTTGISTGIVNNPGSVIDLGHDVRYAVGTPGRNTTTSFDDFRVWNVARFGSEISNNMNSCLIGSETNLVQLTQFEESTGVSLSSVTGSDGMIVNPSTNWVDGSGICGYNCQLELTTTVTVAVLPEKIGVESSIICAEETIMINGTAYDASNPTGTEIFTNIGPVGCDSTVTINLTVLVALDSILDSTICSYDSIVVNGTIYNASNPSGIEVFSNIGPNGCDSTVTVNLTVTTIDLTVTNNSGNITVAEVGADSYQWYDCANDSTLVSATSQSFTPPTGGLYGVEVSLDGCVDSSMCETVSFAGLLDENDPEFLRIYPNPTNGLLNIEFGTVQSNCEITLRSSNGQVLKTEKLNNVSSLNYIIDEADGLYFIEVRNHKGNHAIFRVVKN